MNGLDLPKVLGAPVEGTLFFAGEATATDAQMGTVFGALESGLRAAGEILRD
jgi:monoamine oxidase